MATKTPKTYSPTDLKQFSKLQGTLQNQLNTSKTAYTPEVTPSKSDLSTQLQLMDVTNKINAANDAALRDKVYGNDSQSNGAKPADTVITRGLKALSAPHDWIAGAVQYALGKGDGSLLNTVSNAHNTNLGYGDILRQEGVTSKLASIPLGFALDVALDPVNWFTAGTDALVPKLFTGLKEGGVEGLTTAAKAGVLDKAAKILKFTPFVGDLAENVATKATAAEDAFRSASNLPSVIDEVIANSQKTDLGKKVLDWALQDEGSLKQKFAQQFVKNFKYSPGDLLQADLAADKTGLAETQTGVRTSIDNFMSELQARAQFTDPMTAHINDAFQGEEYQNLRNDGLIQLTNPTPRVSGLSSNSQVIQDDMSRVAKSVDSMGVKTTHAILADRDATGIKWYDNLAQKMRSNPYAAKAIIAYNHALGFFKASKVPLNYFTAYTNAILSNATMAGMMGFNFANPDYLKALKAGYNVSVGNPIGELSGRVAPEILDFIKEHPIAFKNINLTENALLESIDATKYGTEQANKARAISEGFDTYGKNINTANVTSAKEFIDEIAKKAPQKLVDDLTPFIKDEIFAGDFGATIKKWQKGGNGNVLDNIKKTIANVIVTSSGHYETIDKSFKIGNFLYSAVNGLDQDELRRLARSITFNPGDITRVGNKYILSPEAALKAANETFMNYAAMPNAVKVLRTIPVLGSPFAAFSYAMLTKTGKTLLHNPAFFNKATFLKNEISRAEPQSPLEKEALNGPYYNYLNSYERMKIPFFKEYPVYLNIANYLPYLSLNIFQEPERKYTNPLSQNVGSFVDQSPFLKTPEGQLLYDYFIQPFLLNEAKPTGLFGQPLYYPEDTKLQKAGEVATGIGQAFVPAWFPGGYRFQQMYNALQGKTAQGIDTKTPRSEMVVKAALGNLGIPVNDIDLSNTTYDIRKEVLPKAVKKSKK